MVGLFSAAQRNYPIVFHKNKGVYSLAAAQRYKQQEFRANKIQLKQSCQVRIDGGFFS
jgi:hypothetical protein